MSEYEAPLADMNFLLDHVIGLSEIAELPGFEDAQPEFVAGLLEEAGKFMSEVLSPLNRVGDVEGSRLEAGLVTTPPGFKEAYLKFNEAGWGSVGLPPEFGGAGLPHTVAILVQEMVASACMSFGLCPALGEGAIQALFDHGSDVLKERFLGNLVSGHWSASMCLTEPQAGSDLGALRATAEPADDGSYRIKGTKIFITFGDHDMTENLVHLVLARTPTAPKGVRGISCFLVPKFLVGPDGEIGARNEIETVSLEHKMGIHASPTCVLNFGERDGATGYLIGEENFGLQYMFTMMNHERLMVACQGLAIAERAYQQAVEYAREREQGRAPDSARPKGESSPIIEHADVRRMLMTMRSTIEAMRSLMLTATRASDLADRHPDAEVRAHNEARLALLTPIAKLWMTESGVDLASLAVQVCGGMGYVEETGVAQYLRDARITTIYEGTSGIQAADLVSRKLPLEGGAVVYAYLEEVKALDAELADAGADFAQTRDNLAAATTAVEDASSWLLERLESDPVALASAATPYTEMFALLAGAAAIVRSALTARRIDHPSAAARSVTARYFCEQILPAATGKLAAVKAGSELLFAIEADAL